MSTKPSDCSCTSASRTGILLVPNSAHRRLKVSCREIAQSADWSSTEPALRSCSNAPAERIIRIEPQHILAGDMRGAGDGGHDLTLAAIVPAKTRLKSAAD